MSVSGSGGSSSRPTGSTGVARLLAVVRLLMDLEQDQEIQFVLVFLLVAKRPNRPMNIGEIAEASSTAYASASRNVHKWIKLGMFELEEGTDDRRERFVKLTRKGLGLIQRLEELV